ncbi:hypothetical protein Hypma_005471, partial [Hypsizygus marmoreus]
RLALRPALHHFRQHRDRRSINIIGVNTTMSVSRGDTSRCGHLEEVKVRHVTVRTLALSASSAM